MHEAKTNLSRLLERMVAGEEISITRRGPEIAKLVTVWPRGARRFGIDRGRWIVAGLTIITADQAVGQYPGRSILVGG